MSVLRPDLVSTNSNRWPCMYEGTAYLLIYRGVQREAGLIHGRLDGRLGEHCAIGSYFSNYPHTSLELDLIDEVAAVNDSLPQHTPKQRRHAVLKWLRWRMKKLGLQP